MLYKMRSVEIEGRTANWCNYI